MDSHINRARPPAFCPGCTHDRVVWALDKAFAEFNIPGHKIAIVSDIGCSGLFDVFFNTHAMHGLHGRALTYATGLKLACPELEVVVVMGDGGIGIGGAHFLAACRRNVDLTLLLLNNFNFGMTGGQCSVTTPTEATTTSGFINDLERPLDICQLGDVAGAPYVSRCSGFSNTLSHELGRAISFSGFSVVEIWEVCPGRSSPGSGGKKNLEKSLTKMPAYSGPLAHNLRLEFGKEYRKKSAEQEESSAPAMVAIEHQAPGKKKREILVLGGAGQRIATAGELLCLAAMSGGLGATLKNVNDITVLRGASISEVVFWVDEISFTGISNPDVIIALSHEGVKRYHHYFSSLPSTTLIIGEKDVKLPGSLANVETIDYRALSIKREDWALASLAFMAHGNHFINLGMLNSALEYRFSGTRLVSVKNSIDKVLDHFTHR